MKLLTFVITLFLGSMVVYGAAGFIDAQEGAGGIGGRPAYPREDNTRSESIFIHIIDAGDSVEDGINIVNNTNQPKTVDVYATDSIVSSGGAFACAQRIDETNDVGTWISMDKNQVELEANSSEITNFTISVPGTTGVGEHDGCIVIQESLPDAETDQGIGLSFRTAIRVAIQVPGEIEKNLQYVGFESQTSDSSIVLMPKIENSGNVSIDASIQTYINAFYGGVVSERGGEFPVLRGQTGEWNFEHPRPFWGGLFKATTTASYDQNEDNFIGNNEPDTVSITYDPIWIFVAPHIVALIIQILGVILLLFVFKRILGKRRQRANVKQKWVNHTVRANEDIKSIAKASDESWKKIARANKLKPPYTLQKGSQIKIPRSITSKAKKRKSVDGIS